MILLDGVPTEIITYPLIAIFSIIALIILIVIFRKSRKK